MRITWNETKRRFEASLDRNNFKADLECLKGVGFRTTGPPDWIWFAKKIETLKLLRENKPSSGVMITEEALQKFNDLGKKKPRKPRKARGGQRTADLNRIECPIEKYIPPPPPSILCIFCESPVYFYEKLDPLPICIWCEKTISDKQEEWA